MIGRCYYVQACGNFKDPGTQHFLRKPQIDIVNDINNTINTINIPSPSRPLEATRPPPTTGEGINDSYNNPNGGCIFENCDVLTPTGKILAKDVKVGTIVITPNGTATVTHVLKVMIEQCCIDMMRSESGLLITSYHPVKVNGNWQFPIEASGFKKERLQTRSNVAMYSFALNKDHVVIANDIETICFGHYSNDPVLKHDYFGTNKVIDDLDNLSSNGYVTITPDRIMRDSITNLIVKIA